MSVDKYLNKVYCPQNYNCAHLVCEVWKDETGIDISHALQGFLGGRKARRVVLADLRIFKRLKAPLSPCLVQFQSHRDAPHVGIYLRGRVLHITKSGVRFEILETVSIGFKKVGFFAC